MSASLQKLEPRKLEGDEREVCLKVLAEQAGDVRSAVKILAAEFNVPISGVLLTAWRDSVYADRYRQIADQLSKHMEDKLVQDTRELAVRAASVERKLVAECERLIDGGLIREPGKMAVEMSKVKQSNIDKLLALTGRPSTITVDQSAPQLLRVLEGLGVLRRPERVDAEAKVD